MPKPSCRAAAFILVLHLPAHPAAHAAPPKPPSLAERIDASLAPLYRPDGPGATVIVVKDGKKVFRKAYGMAGIAKKQTLTSGTALRIGSITKQFTATAILMLADEGKLKLDDDLTRYLPDYPTHGKRITIEHLLTHTSGIVSYTGKPGYMADMARDMTVGEMIDRFKDDPLEFAPGTDWRYNNSGYFLLGAIIEKVSGLPYADFLQQRIFTPLGITHTAYEGHELRVFPHAQAYTPDADGFRPSPPLSMTQPYAAGALVSSVDDLARWDAAIDEGKLLKASTWKRALTSHTLRSGRNTGYGYGWEIISLRGAPAVAHGGAITGFRSYALRLPEQHIYVAVLSNADAQVTSPDGPARRAAALALGKPYPEYKAIVPGPGLLDACAGLYRLDDKANWTVRRKGDGLTMQAPGGPLIPLQAFSDGGFFAPGSVDWIEFRRDAQGAVSELVLHRDEGDKVNPRVGAVSARKAVAISHAAFDARVGRYRFAPGFEVELTREGERLFAQATNQPKLEIFALDENAFFSDAVNAELRFNDADPANTVVLDEGGVRMNGVKLDAAPAGP